MRGMSLSAFRPVHFQAIRKSDLQVGKALSYHRSQPEGHSRARVFVPSRVRVPTESEKNSLGSIAEAILSAFVFRSRRSDDYVWVKGHWYDLDGSSASTSKEMRKEFRTEFWNGVNEDFSPMAPDWQPDTWGSFFRKLWNIKFTFRF
jgi:hypothetical protein